MRSAFQLFEEQAKVDGRPVYSFLSSDLIPKGFVTPELHDVYGIEDAVAALLRGSGLAYVFHEPTQIQIVRPEVRDGRNPSSSEADADSVVVVQAHRPELFLKGSHQLNADIRRPQDGTRPYAVIDREAIERSGAETLEAALNRLVPANLPAGGAGATNAIGAGQSRINLRGMGAEETLVLIDGRRIGPLFIGGARGQGDLGSIPLAAVDRIEVLSASASGIYGGGATGGVVNIVLRHDCPDARVVATYGNTFESDSANRGAFVADCMKSLDGRSQLSFSLDVSEQSPLLEQDRKLAARGRALVMKHNAPFYLASPGPPVGAQTNVRSADGTGLGGEGNPAILSIPAGYDRTQGIGPLLANAGQYGLSLANTAEVDGGGRSVIRNGPRTRYANGNFSQVFSEKLTGYADMTYSRTDVENPTSVAPYAGLTGVFIAKGASGNVFDQDVIVSAPAAGGDGLLANRLESRRLATGLNFYAPRDWTLGLEYSMASRKQRWSQLVGSPASEAVVSGQLDVFQDLTRNALDLTPYERTLFAPALDSQTSAFSLRAAGALARLSSGDVTLASLLEHRREQFDGGYEYESPLSSGEPVAQSRLTPQRREITSAYVELQLPFGSVPMRTVGRPRFELQLAGRFDQYSTNTAQPRVSAAIADSVERSTSRFRTVNPTVSFQYRPSSRLAFRGSFGTGFAPPSGDELAPPVSRIFPRGAFLDPKRGNEPAGFVSLLVGGNPELDPERSRSWSAGILLEPGFAGGLQMSLDYVETTKTNNIVDVSDLAMADFPLFQARYPWRVKRAPAAPDDPYGVGPITAIEANDINVAEARIKAWDLDMHYDTRLWRRGQLGLNAHVTWQPEYRTRAAPGFEAENDIAITACAPFRLGAVAGATYSRGNIRFNWTTRYFGSYRVSRNSTLLLNQGGRDVGHQTFHDLSVMYRLPTHWLSVDGVDVQVSALNVFDEKPAFDAGTVTSFSPLGDPRGAVYGVGIVVHF